MRSSLQALDRYVAEVRLGIKLLLQPINALLALQRKAKKGGVE